MLDRWVIKECQQGLAIIVNRESQVEVHIKKEVIMIAYSDVKAYFSKLENGYASLHFPMSHENIDLFEYKLQENDIALF